MNKPLLHNGFLLGNGVVIKNRVDKAFFTEIYSLTDNHFLYLFTNFNQEEILHKLKNYQTIRISCNDTQFADIIVDDYSREKLSKIIDHINSQTGFLVSPVWWI